MPPESDFASARVNQALTPEDKLRLYQEMARIRAFELAAYHGYMAGGMRGFLFVQGGQEAIPVTVRSLMEPEDHSICGPRGMGTALAAGLSMKAGMAELFGKATGCAHGKGGAFGFFDTEHHHWGGYASAATQTALAAGLAFGLKYQGTPGVAFCFLGDGAVNQGVFHEALNLSALFHLPVIYLIENNGYAMGTSVQRSSALNGPLAKRAEGYGIEWDLMDGNDPYEMRAKLAPAIERARQEHRPTVIEIATYRFAGFTISDANRHKYRTKQEEHDRVQDHDPIKIWGERLIHEGLADVKGLALITAVARAEAREATRFAKASTYPEPGDILQDVYWEVDHQTAAGMTGRHLFE